MPTLIMIIAVKFGRNKFCECAPSTEKCNILQKISQHSFKIAHYPHRIWKTCVSIYLDHESGQSTQQNTLKGDW